MIFHHDECWAPPALSHFIDSVCVFHGAAGGEESVWFGNLRMASLPFADDVVLLAPTHHDLQQALGQFGAKCEVAVKRISTSKSEARVLYRKNVDCSLWFGSELL